MRNRIEAYLTTLGYFRMTTNVNTFVAYYKEESSFVSLFLLADLTKEAFVSRESFNHISQRITYPFIDKGLTDIHLLSLVFTKDVEQASEIIKDNNAAWIIDVNQQKLRILDGKMEDYYGFKSKIEKALTINYEDMIDTSKQDYQVGGKKKYKRFVDRPLVTHGFFILNILIFTLCTLTGDLIYNIGTMYPVQVLEEGKYYQLITSMFLHGGFDHIFGNMILLFFIGEAIEDVIGHGKFFILYMLSGLIGNLVSLFSSFLSGDPTGSLGASGAIFGVMGAIIWILLSDKHNPLQFDFRRALFMIGYSLFMGFTSTGIDNAAHIGGFIGGFLISIFLYKKKKAIVKGKDTNEN